MYEYDLAMWQVAQKKECFGGPTFSSLAPSGYEAEQGHVRDCRIRRIRQMYAHRSLAAESCTEQGRVIDTETKSQGGGEKKVSTTWIEQVTS